MPNYNHEYNTSVNVLLIHIGDPFIQFHCYF